jgi:phage-related protein
MSKLTNSAQATALAKTGADVYEVRRRDTNGIRRFGFFTDYDEAAEIAETNNAEIFDWATGDYA